jgi:hypothetical protein
MNTASKEVVCFKTIMQHSLVYAASSAISCIRAPENPFLEHSSSRIKYFSSVVID